MLYKGAKMSDYALSLIEKLAKTHSLSVDEYEHLLDNQNDYIQQIISKKACRFKESVYGNKIFIRGLIEISNICKNNCLYCGIRCDNSLTTRYRLTKDEIIHCCEKGYKLGFRTFVLQGGEDMFFTDEILCDIISSIKQKFSDCAITLSLGERSYTSYSALYNAGADRYLLRHETADENHYNLLHNFTMDFDNRISCLYNLKKIGYQTGCGFMVGSPFQTNKILAKDLKFIEEFSPDMCGIGPFVPHKDTPFAQKRAGEVKKTTYLLSIIRLIKPNILLPSTTALATIDKHGHKKAILSGANVIMPNLSPDFAKQNYQLYNNKKHNDNEDAENIKHLLKEVEEIGSIISFERGDIINTHEVNQ